MPEKEWLSLLTSLPEKKTLRTNRLYIFHSADLPGQRRIHSPVYSSQIVEMGT